MRIEGAREQGSGEEESLGKAEGDRALGGGVGGVGRQRACVREMRDTLRRKVTEFTHTHTHTHPSTKVQA